ncbi:hypothetical protein RsS62_31080 [Rhizobium dioscoreae]|nr:hypothetical protein RsS62_31080 [Rhizobium dioscoreae]
MEFGERFGGEIAALRQARKNGTTMESPFDLAFQNHKFIPKARGWHISIKDKEYPYLIAM